MARPRAKPTSVMPSSRAMSTARLVGAETATIAGMPAMAAFWTGWGIERPPPREQLAWALSHRFGILRRHLDLAGVHVVPGDLERLAETLHG